VFSYLSARGEGGTGRVRCRGMPPRRDPAGLLTPMEVTTMDSAERSQHTLWQLSDDRDKWRDPMAPFRELCRVQRDALRGDPDDVYCPEYGPF
jgi:hypothetical protein